MRQLCLDGAVGARAIHSIRNYKRDDPVYDGNAYSLSANHNTSAHTLRLSAHFTSVLRVTSCHSRSTMAEFGGWQMTGSIDSCRQGITAFRNARDLAQEFRDDTVRIAFENLSRPPAEDEGSDIESRPTHYQLDDADDDDESHYRDGGIQSNGSQFDGDDNGSLYEQESEHDDDDDRGEEINGYGDSKDSKPTWGRRCWKSEPGPQKSHPSAMYPQRVSH